MSDDRKLPAVQAQRIFDTAIVPAVFGDSRKQAENPVAVLFGGAPGAGNGAVLNDLARSQPGIVIIETDALRAFHPRNERARDPGAAGAMVDSDVDRWRTMAIDYAAGRGLSLAVESPFSQPDTVRASAAKLADHGYKVELHLTATSEIESWQGVYQRYEDQVQRFGAGQARFTPRETHDTYYDAVRQILEVTVNENLVSRVIYRSREGAVLHDTSIEAASVTGSRAPLDEARNRLFTQAEIEQHDARWQEIQRSQDARGAPDTERLKTAAWRVHDRFELEARVHAAQLAGAQTKANLDQARVQADKENQQQDREKLDQLRRDNAKQAREIEAMGNRAFTEEEKDIIRAASKEAQIDRGR